MKKRIFSILLVLVMVFSLIPLNAMALDRDDSKQQTHVIVENTTFLEPVDGVEPAWTGTLVDTWVDLTEESTMMTCVVAALDEVGATQTGAESNYISEINGLAAFDGGAASGWMGTLNDWFTNQGFGGYTVKDGTLEAGDEIRIMYTSNGYGEDLGGSWNNNDTSLKALAFSDGVLTPDFESTVLAYTLTVPAGVSEIVVTPTAANKNFQVHTKIGETEYKRTAYVPVADGTELTIEVGTGPSMNGEAEPTVYKVTVAEEKTPVDPAIPSEWPSFQGGADNNGLTSARTPRTAAEAELRWSAAAGEGWSNAPSPLILVDDAVVTMAGSNLVKFDKATGEMLAKQPMAAATSWGSTPPCYADGVIFCQLGGAVVQAFNAVDLQPMWTYDDELNGQAQSPIVYSDGKIYVGMGYGDASCFLCLDAATGELVWREENPLGFYWAGAAVVGDAVIFGSEDGHVYSRNKLTGEAISALEVPGLPNIRSSVAYADGQVFFTTKTSQFCAAKLDEATGVLSDLRVVDCAAYGAQCTSTPVVYNGIAYFGAGGWSGDQSLIAVNTATMEVTCTAQLPANPQSSAVLSTYFAEDGFVYLYLTCNANPGGIQVVKAAVDGTSAEVSDVFVPAEADQQYCICSVTVDSEGSLYYKNDSCKVFKIGLSQTALDADAAAPVIALIDAIGEPADSAMQITAARKAYDALTDAQKALVTNYDKLTAAEQALSQLPHADAEKMFAETGDLLEKMYAEEAPMVGSIGGEWVVIGLVRSGREVPDGYYENVESYVAEKIRDPNKEQLHRAKSTDNSRVILALTAMGMDVTDVAGHNLLKGLSDMKYLKRQGNNGPIWALIAFDSNAYEIPTVYEGGEQVTREGLIQYILDVQLPDGGWALSNDTESSCDADMTGMALQALAPYYGENEAVTAAVDQALAALSSIQLANGGYASWGTVNVESCVQVLVALNSLGIDAGTDERFIKNGRTIVDALSEFYVDGGGFRHITTQEDLDGMATEQSYYGLTSMFRLAQDKTALYDMTDVICLPFRDIALDAWYREDVRFVVDAGIMVGLRKGDFGPSELLSRGQMVTMLYRMAGSPAVSGEMPFEDVSEGKYFTDAVLWAFQNQITKGEGAKVFNPYEKLTRAEAATFLMRFARYQGVDTSARADLSGYTDAGMVPGFAEEAMQWAVASGLVQGTAGGKLNPDEVANRAQSAALMHRFVELIAE